VLESDQPNSKKTGVGDSRDVIALKNVFKTVKNIPSMLKPAIPVLEKNELTHPFQLT